MVSRTVIIGAGPAGLTAAYALAQQAYAESTSVQTIEQQTVKQQRAKRQPSRARQAIVLEQLGKVGGRSRYETYQGYTLDLGAHRFTTQIPEIQLLWQALIPGDLMSVSGLSRIVYRYRFFDYPLAFTNALKQIGPIDATLATLSYLLAQVQAQLFPSLATNAVTDAATDEQTAKDWIVSHFGRHLYHLFFESYFQKILGMPADQIHSDWIKACLGGAALPEMMAAALSSRSGTASTFFSYPLLGPGMLWERCRTHIEMMGSKVHTRTKVVQIERTGDRIDRVIVERQAPQQIKQQPQRSTLKNNSFADSLADSFSNTLANRKTTLSAIEADQFIASLPLADLIAQLDPPAPPLVRRAAKQLKYRSSIMAALMIPAADIFPDTTLYIHDPALQVGRIQNFKNWSAFMVPDKAKTCLGLEYFCTEDNALWRMDDRDLIRLASQELVALGLVLDADAIEDATVIRQPKTHALLTQDYYKPLAIVQDYLSNFENLQTVGNGGGHCDLKHDESAFSGLLAARHIVDNSLDKPSQQQISRKRTVV